MFVTVHTVIEGQGGGYFCSITYLSEDKEEIRGREREREGICMYMHVSVGDREPLLRIWLCSQCGNVCS